MIGLRSVRRSWLRSLAAFAAAASIAAVARSAPSGPVAVIERLDAAYLEVLERAERLGFEGRVEKLRPALAAAFDFQAMARLSVGGRWKDLSPEQQSRLEGAIARLSVATTASRFTGHSGERFEILGEEPSTQGTVLVRTRVVVPGKEPVQLDYRLRAGPEGWRVIDIFLNGTVSELALRRSEYGTILDRDGFDALIASIDAKASEMAMRPTAAAGRPQGRESR